jgi:multidrug efflux pump
MNFPDFSSTGRSSRRCCRSSSSSPACCRFSAAISEYPDVVPPSVVVRAQYPGANPKVIAETVAAAGGADQRRREHALHVLAKHLRRRDDADRHLQDRHQRRAGRAQVQNRVQRACRACPKVRQIGVTTVKASPNLTMVVHLVSPNSATTTCICATTRCSTSRTAGALPGMGEVQIFGSGDYAMRVWLDPQKVAARGLTASDVVDAIREQNVQVAAGVIGASPAKNSDFQLTVNARAVCRRRRIRRHHRAHQRRRRGDAPEGRGARGDGRQRLRAAFAAEQQSGRGMGIFQAPGCRAAIVGRRARHHGRTEKDFPRRGIRIVYDPTQFVRSSIEAVIHTLLEAIALVVLVVILFLQTWRASIIPLLAVPVSVVGTFAVMLGFGFSINTLSLFGLVLAIGIVVDDAIVVVENVERNIEDGLSPREATIRP